VTRWERVGHVVMVAGWTVVTVASVIVLLTRL
jgi:hypothetical protein